MSVGYWLPTTTRPCFTRDDIAAAASLTREVAYVIRDPNYGYLGVGLAGAICPNPVPDGRPQYPVLAVLPPVYPEWLGDQSFLQIHNVRFPYIAGEMAHAIASTRLVIAMAKARMLAFYGAGGVSLANIERAIVEIREAVEPDGLSWGANLIHSPNEPGMEDAVADIFLRNCVRRICASAYMRLTPAVVRYACSGLRLDPSGQIVRTNHLFAKLSRTELATMFLSPAPPNIVNALVQQGKLTEQEAHLAQYVPLAEDITVEADSGGHTDNRPLVALFPTITALRDRLSAQYGYTRPIRVGVGGGLGTPAAIAGAFALGAAYVLTGSINQSSVEAGTSDVVKQMLAQAELADVVMAPAPDMFEQGVKVQVLKKGTMFAGRASQLYELYVKYNSIEQIPPDVRQRIERDLFRVSLDDVWRDTVKFFEQRDPKQVEKANKDPKHKMALIFRWYVGQSSHWAIRGDESRRFDYQIWCGPAMGAFNAWTKGSFLAEPANRSVVQIALNLMEGAAVITRAQQLRTAGIPVPDSAFQFQPRPL